MLKNAKQERLIWLDIIITLITSQIMAYFYYGARSAFVAGIAVVTAAATEFICLRLRRKPFTADDLTCTSDAMILTLMVPTVIDYKIMVIACVFAIAVAKNVFGGRKNMIFSPAAAGYVFLLTSWRSQTLQFTEPHVHTGLFEKAANLVSSASHTFNVSGKLEYSNFELLMGNCVGPTGSAYVLLLAISAVILLFRRDISAGAFIGSIAGTVIMSILSPTADSFHTSVKYALITNMVLFASVYIVADKRIAPKKDYYAFFYGLFIAIVSYILVLTMAKENAIVIVSLLFTPVALALKNLEKRIENEKKQEEDAAASENEEKLEAEINA
ncbi:MAG TPA: RnfABCDGE type electron transport complex subunit D [Ruminococcus flavefaciens]|nr:RnfABCDGE type electron transport complex subunit D [Ruminococcus flavefaciens]